MAGVLAIAFGAAAQASEGVLDQTNPGGSAGLNGIGHQWQQEVTAGVRGRLAGVMLYGDGAVRVRIAEGEAYHTGPFAFDGLFEFAPQSLDGLFIDTRAANIILSAGDTFVIDLSESTSGYTGSVTPYAGGDLWLTGGGWPGPTNFTALYGTSLMFETFMEAVPEPSTWAMMIVGFGAAGSMIRRRPVAA